MCLRYRPQPDTPTLPSLLARIMHERPKRNPDGWRRGRLSRSRRSGPPSSRPQLEELRSGERVTEPGAREPPPATGPVRLARGPSYTIRRSRVPQARIEPLAHGIADDVHAVDGEEDGGAGGEGVPGPLEHVLSRRRHLESP